MSLSLSFEKANMVMIYSYQDVRSFIVQKRNYSTYLSFLFTVDVKHCSCLIVPQSVFHLWSPIGSITLSMRKELGRQCSVESRWFSRGTPISFHKELLTGWCWKVSCMYGTWSSTATFTIKFTHLTIKFAHLTHQQYLCFWHVPCFIFQRWSFAVLMWEIETGG